MKKTKAVEMQAFVSEVGRPQWLHRPGMLFVLFTHNKTRVVKAALQPRIFVGCLSPSMKMQARQEAVFVQALRS